MVVNLWRKVNKDWLAVILLSALLILASLSFSTQYFLKSLTDFLAVGISSVKVYAILGFFILAFLLRALKVRPSFKIKKSWLVYLIIILALLGLSLYLSYDYAYGIGFWQQSFTAQGANFSGSTPDHSHIMKPVMVVLGQAIGLDQPKESYDNGYSTYLIMPHWPYYLGAALIVLLALGLVFYWLRRSRDHEGDWNFGFDLIYLLSSFVVLKNLVDGGIFGGEFLLAFVIWHLASELGQKKWKKLFYWALAAMSAILIFIFAQYSYEQYLWGHLSYSSTLKGVLLFFILTLAAYSLGFIPHLWSKNKHFFAAAVAVLAISVIFWLSPLYSLTSARDRYGDLTIGPNDYAVITTLQDLNFQKLAQEGDLKLYRLTTEKAETTAQVSWQYHLPLDYQPIKISGKDCLVNLPSYMSTFAIDVEIIKQDESFNAFKNYKSDIIKVIDWKQIDKKSSRGQYPVYRMVFSMTGCVPQPQRTLVAFLSANGLNNFIFYPDKSADNVLEVTD